MMLTGTKADAKATACVATQNGTGALGANAHSREKIERTIADVLSQIAPEAELDDLERDEDIREAFDIDSFDFLNLLIGLNERLGVEIPEADYGQLNTLDDLVGYLESRVA